MADDVLGVLIAGGQNPASLSLREWCAVTWRIVTEHAEPEDRALYSAVFNATSRESLDKAMSELLRKHGAKGSNGAPRVRTRDAKEVEAAVATSPWRTATGE